EVVGSRLAEHDGPTGAKPRHLERIAGDGFGKELRPLGARGRGGETLHVVYRFAEDRHAVEWTQPATVTMARVGGTCPGERGIRGKHVDRVPRRPVFAAALQRT